MATIFITEKPSVAREYLKVLQINSNNKGGYYEGNSPVMKANVIITWAVGHLVGICPPEKQDKKWKGKWKEIPMPVIPENFKYAPIADVKDQFDVVKNLYTRKDIDTIYYAGDSGREGIYIQALIRNQIFPKGNKLNEKVVWIDSFTEQAILAGIKNAKPYSHYEPMVKSGYMRAISDWLIGMNFTIAFTLNTNELINTGRVVTPTLAMIVDRQNEIDKFVKTDFYGVTAKLENSVALWRAVEGSKYFDTPMLYNENGLKDKKIAETLVSEFNGDKKLKVVNVAVQEKKEYPKYLFNLADLQAYCSQAFKITPAKTLEIAQYLYEKKFTTYPRTDSRFLSTAVATDYLNRFGYNIPKRYVDDNKVSDHYAIIPTFEVQNPNFETDLQKNVYNAILKRFLDTMKPPYVYDAVTITYQHSNGEYFFEGFRKVKQYGFREGVADADAVDKPVPNKNDTVNVSSFAIREMETKPPSAFTTGTLIMAMEKAGKLIDDEELREQIKTCGIGTSATRASIIEKLEQKKFITIHSKTQKIEPTDLGKKIIPIISSFDETLVSPVKTADMEQKLNNIANNQLSSDEFLADVKTYVAETTAKILNSEKKYLSNNNGKGGKIMKCPNCKSDVIEGQYGWYCTGRCGMNVAKVYGHELTEKQIESLCNGEKITFEEKGKKTTVLPSFKENEWNGKTYYNWETEGSGGGNTSGNSETYTCPNCNEDVVKGQYGWYCKGRCGMNIAKYYGVELTDEQVKALCEGDEVTIKCKNGKDETISQPPVKNEWNGKTYYNWSKVK